MDIYYNSTIEGTALIEIRNCPNLKESHPTQSLYSSHACGLCRD